MRNISGNSTAFISETRRLSWCYWSVLKRSWWRRYVQVPFCASSCVSKTHQNSEKDITSADQIGKHTPQGELSLALRAHFSFFIHYHFRFKNSVCELLCSFHEHLMCDRHFLVFLADTIVLQFYVNSHPSPQPSRWKSLLIGSWQEPLTRNSHTRSMPRRFYGPVYC